MTPPARRFRSTESEPAHRATSLVFAGRVWHRGRLRPLEIGVNEDGRISSIGHVRDGDRRHDVGDRVILPAATDLHVHLREPGPGSPTESIATGTIQAALGGVTLVGEMPNTDPPVTTSDRLEEKIQRATGRAAVDLLLYAAPLVPRELPVLARHAGAFKLYLSPTTGIDEPLGGATLPDLLRELAAYDLPVSVHAEDPTRFRDDRRAVDPASWSQRRPPEAEAGAVDQLLVAPPGLRLHVAHVTTASSAARLRRRGISFEVTPHHLLLSDRSGSDARFKVNPPLREETVRQDLWEAYRAGEVPCVASDHAPHAPEAKARGFDLAPSGMPGLETMLPLLLARVRAGELPLEVLLASACDRPARWFGQPLGRIAVGHRANLLVVDFRQRRAVHAGQLRAPCGWTAFEGREAIFPVEHWRDGERVVADGEYVGRPTGRVVRPEFAPGAPDRLRAESRG